MSGINGTIPVANVFERLAGRTAPSEWQSRDSANVPVAVCSMASQSKLCSLPMTPKPGDGPAAFGLRAPPAPLMPNPTSCPSL